MNDGDVVERLGNGWLGPVALLRIGKLAETEIDVMEPAHGKRYDDRDERVVHGAQLS